MVPDSLTGLPTPPAAKGGRLDSWKEIARHLRRGLTTVQRWERQEGLPIHRHLHSTGGSVFAYTADLDRWLAGRDLTSTPCGGQAIPSTTDGRWEAPGGAMPLDSPYYIARAADDLCRHAIAQRSAIVLIKGVRQVGKSSLLARALAGARQQSAAVAFTDMQALARDDLRSPKAFYQALGRSIADQIRPSPSILNTWHDRDSPNTNFSRYVQRLIAGVHKHVVWGLDEVDRLVGHEYAGEVFGLFRSWHNLRALDPAAPWDRLTLVMAYATECQLLITNVNESPFNVGVRTTLDDFDVADVMTLNERHGALLDSPAGVRRLMELVGGHPYLLQCAFDALRRGASLETLERDAAAKRARSARARLR